MSRTGNSGGLPRHGEPPGHLKVFWFILFVIGLTHAVVIAAFGLRKMVGTRCSPTLVIRVVCRPSVWAVRPTRISAHQAAWRPIFSS